VQKRTTVVYKLGGSLLDLADLPARLQRLLDQEQTSSDLALFVVGGGLIVDAVRHYDAIHKLPTEASHWLCVDLMNSTAEILCQLTGWQVIRKHQELCNCLWDEKSTSNLTRRIVAPSSFYSRTTNATALPISWQSTSDSIAACLANLVNANELVMLKSADHTSEDNNSLVDEAFSAVVGSQMKFRFVNIRKFE
jgi:5-(aminomethyl)-3-furanmethanol phosphate kinase